MFDADATVTLRQGMALSQMSWPELWLRYIGVGGDGDELNLSAHVLDLLAPTKFEHDIIAQAINEHFLDHGGAYPVGYWAHEPVPTGDQHDREPSVCGAPSY
jgi:hypothetical protein